MCFRYKKKIDTLTKKVDELTDIIKTNELVRLREESKDYKTVLALLKDVRLEIKSVRSVENQDGTDSIVVEYNTPSVVLTTRDGETSTDKFLYAVNMLNLISMDDMEKIRKVINKVEKKQLGS